MAFYKKIQMAINKKWYPQSCPVFAIGTPKISGATLDEVA